MDASAIYAALLEGCMTVACIPAWDGDKFVSLDPLTWEEAHLLAPALTARILSLLERAAA